MVFVPHRVITYQHVWWHFEYFAAQPIPTMPLFRFRIEMKVYGVSTRFVQGIVNRFREEVASELNHTVSSSDARTSAGKQPRGSGSCSRKGRGKQRKRGGSKKADIDVSVDVEYDDEVSNPTMQHGGDVPGASCCRGVIEPITGNDSSCFAKCHLQYARADYLRNFLQMCITAVIVSPCHYSISSGTFAE